MVLFKIGTRELGKGFVVGWKTGRHGTMEGRKSSLLTSPGSRRFLCFRAVSCPISTNGSISRRVAQHDSRSSRQTGAPPLFPIPVPSSSNRGEAAAPCLLSFPPQRPYPPGQCDAFWLPSPKATTPPACIAPRHDRGPPLLARVGTTTFSLVPCAFANCHHVENENELLAAKTPSPHESRAVPVRGHHSPVTYTRCGDRVTYEITGHLSSADGRQSFAPSRGVAERTSSSAR